MSVLGKKQEIFTRLSNELETWALSVPGVEIRGGEWLRTEAQARWNATHCARCQQAKIWHTGAGHSFRAIGIVKSNHRLKLAKDYNVFRNGVWLRKSEDLLWLGERWEAMSGTYREIEVVCCWGGRFVKRPDGNHFSLLHRGVR
jgi:hypothetical protein